MLKKGLSILLVLIMMITAFPFAITSFAETEIHTSKNWKYCILNDNTVEIKKYTASSTDLVIPSEIDGMSVSRIGDLAFNGSAFVSVTIPQSVELIGERAFSYCAFLEEFIVDANNENYISQNGILFNKEKSELLYYPAAKTETSYSVPANVKKICDCAFTECASITSITIGKNVSSIGDFVFNGCTSLKGIKVSKDNACYCSVDGVLFDKNQTVLIKYPSKNTTAHYCIPNCVKRIEKYAFQNCPYLKEIDIPENVTVIGGYDNQGWEYPAFESCANLKSVWFNGTKKEWNSILTVRSDDNILKAAIYCSDGAINGKTGFVKKDGKYYYYKEGVMLKGWQKIKRANGKTYYHYFNKYGVMLTGWQNITNSKGITHRYYFGSNGCMRTGWQYIKNSKGVAYKYYFNQYGVMFTNLHWIANSKGVKYRYYFGANGYMRTGWQKIKASNGKNYWYYFYSNGVNAINRNVKIGNKTYKFNKYGVCTNK